MAKHPLEVPLSSHTEFVEPPDAPRPVTHLGMKITILANRGSIVPLTRKPDDLGLWAEAPYGLIDGTDVTGETALYVFVGDDPESRNVFLVPIYGDDKDAREFLYYKILLGWTDKAAAEAFVMEQFGRSYDLGSLVQMSFEDLEDWVEVAKMGPEPEEEDEIGFLKDPDLTIVETEKPPLFRKD